MFKLFQFVLKMGVYKELHIDSAEDNRNFGTKNRPLFYFTEPLYATHFAVKSVSLPMSFVQLTSSCRLQVSWPAYIGLFGITGGTEYLTVPSGSYSNSSLAALLQAAFTTQVLQGPYGYANFATSCLWLSETEGQVTLVFSGPNPAPTPSHVFTFSWPDSVIDESCLQLQKLMGAGTTIGIVTPVKMSNLPQPFTVWKFSFPNYLMMRSSLGSGASFGSNLRGEQAAYETNDIIAKIPLNPAIVDANNQYLYQNNTLTRENMFTFNGNFTDGFDVYFTKPGQNEPVDFRQFNFSATLSFIDDRELYV